MELGESIGTVVVVVVVVDIAGMMIAHCLMYLHVIHGRGASMVFFPECFSLVGEKWTDTVSGGQSLDGPVMTLVRAIAKDYEMWLSMGGFPESIPGEEGKVYNTHVIIDNSGLIQATYRKIHLFDVVRKRQDK